MRTLKINNTTKVAVPDNKLAFDNIYAKKVWGDAGGGSGVGSDIIKAATTGYILELVLIKYALTSLLDSPCGGVTHSWMRVAITRIRSHIPCFHYHGVDVVDTVIQRNKQCFKNHHWAEFTTLDLSSPTISLPTNYGLILSRDALQHLPYASIAGALSTYCNAKAQYLLVGTYLDHNDNRNIKSGEYFSINLLHPPFSFPQPFEIYNETNVDNLTNKYLLLYHLPELCASKPLQAFVNTYTTPAVVTTSCTSHLRG